MFQNLEHILYALSRATDKWAVCEYGVRKQKKANRFLSVCWHLDLVGLELRDPVNTIQVMLSQSVYLTTPFLGRLGTLSG